MHPTWTHALVGARDEGRGGPREPQGCCAVLESHVGSPQACTSSGKTSRPQPMPGQGPSGMPCGGMRGHWAAASWGSRTHRKSGNPTESGQGARYPREWLGSPLGWLAQARSYSMFAVVAASRGHMRGGTMPTGPSAGSGVPGLQFEDQLTTTWPLHSALCQSWGAGA